MRLRPLPRDHWQREVERLDPETQYEQIMRIVAKREFPWDFQQALSFALFRTYAVPTIGRLLAATDQFEGHTQKRHDDTVLVLDTVLSEGMESRPGRSAVRRMNQMHGSYDISNEDMLYVLCAFVVMPVRWVEQHGYRPLSEREVLADVRYYQRLGRLMNITGMPEDYAGFERLLDQIEARRFAYDPGGRAVADSTLGLFVEFYPRPVRPFMGLFSKALMDDHLLRAFGYSVPPRWVREAAHRSLELRGRLLSRLPSRRKEFDVAASRRIRSYPGGFLVERLGTFPETMPELAEDQPA
ncbi:L-aspartate oxidase [Aeromicrobium sp. Root495]|uniref:oxygenase MpaB family protein n=1 Tax=Aeromicrobium sp. Root495 TaxID=1736550 RepID=UPI0006FD6889|nr:oxygenase MpaB family protein [Aeromicrobium sp. Root495]KQY58634.1 L-aspartate oxidase [Aeromicrobium sp. Root495]